MPGKTIAYHFTLLSPWAYLGHDAFLEIAARHGCAIDFRPVALGTVFAQTGGVPLAQRHPARQAYRMIELQRWRDRRGLALQLRPAFFPCDIALADRAVLALAAAGRAPGAYVRAALAAVWAQDRNCADPAVLAALLRECGEDEALLQIAASEATKARYARLTEEAIAMGVVGSPCYVLDGEPFWGQDRLDLLEDALESGRAGYRA